MTHSHRQPGHGLGRSVDYAGPSRVDVAIEAQAAVTPDAWAIVDGDAHLTFHQLNIRANQMAHYLRRRGAKTGDLIGICLERSLDLPVAVLAVLKAGCVYVPLDPAYPRDRLTYMISAANTALVMTHSHKITQLGINATQTVLIDDPVIATQATSIPPGPRESDQLIYVIFTSGSTGQPKGAGVYHHGFTNLMQWFIGDFTIHSHDRTLLVSSFSFDLTQKNIFAPLMTGGQLHMLQPGPFDPQAMTKQIRDQAITLINCTPSAFYPLAESADAAQHLASLRCVFLGGEPIATRRLSAWMRDNHYRCEIANTYGPTECTDICVFHRLTSSDYAEGAGTVPIGRPVPNTAIVLCDDDGKPSEFGREGELCVAGIGVGAGYINDVALTAQKFIANPFAELPGDRLYKTGDLARWRADGLIEYLGRIDQQVKLRGFRIELGEIEAALATHPAVGDCVIAVRGDDDAKRLVAYIVCRPDYVLTDQDMRAHLKQRIPDFMQPSACVTLAALPLSPNGKIDRRALPEPATTILSDPIIPSAIPSASPLGSHMANEQAIAAIWCRVLKTAHVGLDDNFFDLGGNSLQVAEIHAELCRHSPAMPITALFQFPTVRTLARHLGSDTPSSSVATAVTAVNERARQQQAALAARRRGMVPPPSP